MAVWHFMRSSRELRLCNVVTTSAATDLSMYEIKVTKPLEQCKQEILSRSLNEKAYARMGVRRPYGVGEATAATHTISLCSQQTPTVTSTSSMMPTGARFVERWTFRVRIWRRQFILFFRSSCRLYLLYVNCNIWVTAWFETHECRVA